MAAPSTSLNNSLVEQVPWQLSLWGLPCICHSYLVVYCCHAVANFAVCTSCTAVSSSALHCVWSGQVLDASLSHAPHDAEGRIGPAAFASVLEASLHLIMVSRRAVTCFAAHLLVAPQCSSLTIV